MRFYSGLHHYTAFEDILIRIDSSILSSDKMRGAEGKEDVPVVEA